VQSATGTPLSKERKRGDGSREGTGVREFCQRRQKRVDWNEYGTRGSIRNPTLRTDTDLAEAKRCKPHNKSFFKTRLDHLQSGVRTGSEPAEERTATAEKQKNPNNCAVEGDGN